MWQEKELACGVLDICDVRQHEAAPVWTADEPLSSVPSAGPGAASQVSTRETAVALVGVMLPRCSWSPEAIGGDELVSLKICGCGGVSICTAAQLKQTSVCLHSVSPHSRAWSFVDPALQ